MKRIIFSRLTLTSVLVTGFTLATVPAAALQKANDAAAAGGPGKPNVSNSQARTAAISNGSSVESQSETEVEVNSSSTVTTGDDSGHAELHLRGEKLLAELKKQHPNAKPLKQLQKQCVAHKQGLTNRMTNISNNSQKIQTRIDDVFAKAQSYQQAKSVTAADYSSLVAAAQTAQSTSKTSIANLKAVMPTIDCNNVSTASDVATFKAAAQQTRDDLKAYRDDVKAVLKSLISAKASNSTSASDSSGTDTSGGNQ